MENAFYHLNRNGLDTLSVLSVARKNPENFKGPASRSGYLALLAAILGLFTAALGKLIVWIGLTVMQLAFFGKFFYSGDTPADSELGALLLLIPIAGTALFLLLTRTGKYGLKIPALLAATGTGASLGWEAPVMLTGGAFATHLRKLLRISEAEVSIFIITGLCSGLAWYFNAPLAAVLLGLEVLLPAWTLMTLLPLITGVAATWALKAWWEGTEPFFTMGTGPGGNVPALLAYMVIGILIGLLAVLLVKASRRLERLFDRLGARNRWWLLLTAVPVAVIGYWSPDTLGPGERYGSFLLQAHVTLQLLTVLSLLKMIVWLFFSAGNKTGTTVMPLLLMGGATGLLLAVIIQLVAPAVIINPVMAALIGMCAMFAGISRGLFTAVVLVLELTHCLPAGIPAGLAAVAAYGVSFPLLKNKRPRPEAGNAVL
ncbi:chloride channel protein [Chitinophaga sp. Mgbs1]|uniref:Chloride channel protein n=1 Tax=Chitinophaga solisilvae TaxID=1233460 RepID=A0A433WHB3_9BACT|nr:chloride channel protein [Chitinophaga solisilvae]